MQPVEDRYHIGDVILERYQVEDILGVGGFSVVYLVRDRLLEDGEEQSRAEKRFALKMLTDREKQERLRFRYEAEILMRLKHPALPRVYRVFEDETSHQAYMVMDYVEGTNLNILRKQQSEEGFSLSEALTILAPIVEALSYLHTQPSPVIHRDIKPSNVIVPKNGKDAVLVDFGIAKEFEADDTTTAIRHCSPGYAAPEQYSSMGTDQRTDIYALAATLYVLLSSVVPVDALRRATKLASKEEDPLVSVNTLAPAIPAQVAAVIERAMSIDMRKRFFTVREFWQAVQEASGQNDQEHVAEEQDEVREGHPVDQSFVLTRRKPHVWGVLALMVLVFLLVGSLAFGFGLGAYFRGNHGTAILPTVSTPVRKTPTTPLAPTPTVMHEGPSVVGPYAVLASKYNGSVHDLLTNKTITITLTQVAQNNEQISGSFSRIGMQGTLTGVLDMSRHIFFTVSGNPPLFFDGAIRTDGNLVGNYCTVDAAGQCVGQYGVWSFAPVP